MPSQHKPKNNHLSSLALQLFDYVVLVVELFLSSKRKQFENRERRHGPSNHEGGSSSSSSSNGSNGSNGNKECQLKEALAFFDNVSLDDKNEEEAREKVKKQFRQKSRMHHPDRNDNSQESVEMMQKINHYYTIITDELDRRQGIVHPDEEDEDTPTPSKAPPPEDVPKHQQTPKQKKTKKNQAKRNNKKKAKQAAARARRQQEEEWNAVERLFRRQQSMLRREKKKRQGKAYRQAAQNELDTPQGRKRAHDAWWQAQAAQVQQQQQEVEAEEVPLTEASIGGSSSADSSMHDIDDDVDNVATATAPQVDDNNSRNSNSDKDSKNNSTKPKNLVMECCMDETVVALRMGLSEATIVSLVDKQHTFIEDYIWKHHHEASSSSLQDVVRDAGRAFFTMHTLDDDDNTYLHYAVYYENADLVDMIYSHACQFNVLSKTFLQENAYGMIPLDYYYCCAGDGTDTEDSNASFGRKIQSLTDLARDAKPGWSKTMHRLKVAFENIDIVSILNVVACFLVGQIIFGTSTLVSLAITVFDFVVVDLVASEDGGSASNTSLAEGLFTQHVIWCMVRGLYHLVIPTSWGYFSRLVVACCIILPAIIFPMVGSVLSVIGIGALAIVATLFKTIRRCIAMIIAVPPSAKFYYLETLELLLIFSSGAMALQWLRSAIASG